MKLLEVRNLKKHFPVFRGALRQRCGEIRAVDGIDFSLGEGETLGLVGESGCGKSTTAKLVLNLIRPTAGEVFFRGMNIFNLKGKALRSERAHLQIIFQNPINSLNPKMRVEDIIGEPLLIHTRQRRKSRIEKVEELMVSVGLNSKYIRRFPHQFSGGERQRIGIARALATGPRLVVCDEPVSSLDLSIQAQILNLLVDLQKRLNLAYLFISHDLNVVSYISDRIMVMYQGKIVEIAPTGELQNNPLHPYTKMLLRISSDHTLTTDMAEKSLPLSSTHISGCSFYSRCKYVRPQCQQENPPLMEKSPGHFVACHRI